MVMHSSELDPRERTFIMVKPDLVRRGLVNKIMKRFETRGYKLVGLKQIRPTKEQLEAHYEDLKGQHFFDGLIEYMNSGPVVAMIWEGVDAARQGRRMLGLTNPLESAPGTIRADFSLQSEARKVCHDNICHGSDSAAAAEREIRIWFRPEELMDYKPKRDESSSTTSKLATPASRRDTTATRGESLNELANVLVQAVKDHKAVQDNKAAKPVVEKLSNCKLSHEKVLYELGGSPMADNMYDGIQ